MRAFPAASEEGYFHSGGPDDGFQLPDFKRYKDCEVLVELTQPTARPVSSWAEIQVAATQLGMACLMTYSENIGGTTLCGGNDQIRIQITGFGRRVGDVVNETTQDPPATA